MTASLLERCLHSRPRCTALLQAWMGTGLPGGQMLHNLLVAVSARLLAQSAMLRGLERRLPGISCRQAAVLQSN